MSFTLQVFVWVKYNNKKKNNNNDKMFIKSTHFLSNKRKLKQRKSINNEYDKYIVQISDTCQIGDI